MRLPLFTLYLLTALCDGELIPVTGAVGGSVSMTCSYPYKYEDHMKIFCKMVRDRCTAWFKVFTQSDVQENGKSTLTYQSVGRILKVNIDKLTEDDTAVYWCGVSQPGNWIYQVKAFVLHVTPLIGYEGGELSIRCPYEEGDEKNGKYLNRKSPSYNSRSETLIQTNWSNRQTKVGRFSLYDDIIARVFTVTITGLRAEDSGKYECGVKRTYNEVLNKLDATVKDLVNVTGYEGESVSIYCKYQRKDTGREESRHYFCKGWTPSDCVNTGVKVQSNMTVGDRFSLRDEPLSGFFNVTIADLRAEDAGIYWCVEHEGRYIFTQAVHLEVMRVILGNEGGSVPISCNYNQGHQGDHVKKLCKGPDKQTCENFVVSSDRPQEGRFTLKDNSSTGVFTVNITDLRAEDAGIYWCVELCNGRYLWTTGVKVKVEKDVHPQTTLASATPTSPNIKSDYSGLQNPVILSVCLAIVVLVTAVTLFLYCKRRRKKKQGMVSTSETLCMRQAHPMDCVYEEVKDASHPMSPEETVYANTQSPTMQSDGPTYSTVNFHKNQEAAMTDIALSQGQDTCEYAAVKHPTK